MLQRLKTLSIFLILLLVISVSVSGVAEANNAPTTVGTIPSESVKLGGGAIAIEVDGYFSDPDGDVLVFAAGSSDTGIATVSVSGPTVAVAPVAEGTVTITVDAIDPGGLTAKQEVSVTVRPQNRAPVVDSSIPDETLTVGGSVGEVDLSLHFSDPDDDALTYGATSADTAIATVSVSDAWLTITPVAAGTVTISTTATDTENVSTAHTFSVTVNPPNEPPTATVIPSPTIKYGATATVNLDTYFTDPEGETLTYTATASDTGIITVSVSSATLTISTVNIGTASIDITATDPGDKFAFQTVNVSVISNNNAPVAIQIPDKTVAVNQSFTVELGSYFTDADGDAMTYTASSNTTYKATVSLSGATLTVNGVAVGTAEIRVTATDSRGDSAVQTFPVSVKSPPTAVGTIPNISGAVNQAGKTFALSPYFSDPAGQTLTYSASASDTYYVSVYVNSSNELEVTPQAAGNATITVTATNPDGLFATQSFSVAFTESVFVGEADAIPSLSSDELSQLGALINYDTLIFNELYNGSDDANDWLELRNVSAADLPLDDWHLSILIGDGNVVGTFPPGTVIPAGDVLLVTHTKRVGTAEASVLSVAVETFALPQEEFALILQGPSGIGDLAVNYFQSETELSSETAPVLTVDTVWHRNQPIVSGYLAEAWSKSTTQDGLGTPGYRHSSEAADLNNDGTVDILDLVLVASQFGTNGTPAADLNNDGTVNIQDLVLIANAVNDIAAAPGAQQSQASVVKHWLQLARQHATGVAQTSIPEGFSYARGIQVLAQLAQAFVPEATALLANYPNPFNPETWIPYQLSEAADVTVRIYAADGSVVRTLALGHQDAGMYHNRSQAAYWDGRNVFGETVASGLYFYTLVAGEFTATRRMLILK